MTEPGGGAKRRRRCEMGRYKMSPEEEKERYKKIEYLQKYRAYVRQKRRSEIRIREMREKIYPSQGTAGRVQGGEKKDLSDYEVMKEQEEKKYRRDTYKRAVMCREISNRIEAMDNEDEKDLLTHKYIEGMDWAEIAEKMNISERNVYRIHNRAIKHFKI